MIDIQQGHLGAGQWQIREQDSIPFLSHRLAFSPRNEFRIGCDEIIDVQVQAIEQDKRQIKIELSDDRYCIGWASDNDLDLLLNMMQRNEPAPEIQDNQHLWIKGMVIFFIACLLFSLAR